MAPGGAGSHGSLPDQGCEESTSVTPPRPEENMLRGRPRQGPGAGGVPVFLASAHSQRPGV